MVRQFMGALQEAQGSGDVGALVALFADDAELSKLANDQPSRFWRDYLKSFYRVRSSFTHVFEGSGTASLEWVSEGALPGGRPIRYAGVSLLEIEGDRVRRFRAYYDSAAFVSPAMPAT